RLQRLVWERLDDALEWLRSQGADVLAEDTENPLTTGKRFDPRQLTDVLVQRTKALRIGEAAPLDGRGPSVLATGGFGGSPALVARHIRPVAPLRLRANPWSTGDGLEHAVGRGAALSDAMD